MIVQPEPRQEAQCPKCANKEEIRDAGPLQGSLTNYDVMSDRFGVLRCPACGHRACWIEFHPPTK